MQPFPAPFCQRLLPLGLLVVALWGRPSQAAPVVVPADGTRLSLADALDTAAHHHPTLSTAAEQEQADLATEGIEASAIRPHVSLEGVVKDGPNSAPGLGLQGLANSSIIDNVAGTGGDLVYSQPVSDFGRAEHRIAARQFTVKADAQTLLAQDQWVAWGVVQAYNAVLAEQKLLEVAQEDVRSRRLLVRQAQARFEAGLVSRVDVDFANAGRAEAEVRLTEAGATVQQGFAALNNAMGVDATQTYQLEPQATDATEPSTSLEADVRAAIQQRPEIQALNAQIAGLHEQAKAYASDGRPLLRTALSMGALGAQKKDADQPQIYAAGLILTWPFVNGGLVRSEINQVRHQAAALEGRRDTLAQQIRLQVTQARLHLSSLINSLPASTEELRRAQDLIKLATERYRAGLGSLIEVQEAEALLLTAATNVTRLQYQITTAQAALQYATGAPRTRGY